MEEVKIKIFEFKELDKKTQNRIIEEFQRKEEHPFLNEDLKEELQIKLKENKIKPLDNDDITIYYNLSYCQGDGLQFLGDFKYKNYYVKIKEDSLNSSHCYNTNIYIETYKGNEAKEEIQEEFKTVYYGICKDLEKYGYQIIESNTHEETIKHNIEENEYKFYSDGRIFY